MMPAQDALIERLSKLKTIREPRLYHWQDVSSYIVPYRGRYLFQERERGERARDLNVARFNDIIDETGTNAVETAEAGMVALRTSPARKWLRYQTRDPKLNKRPNVKRWFEMADEVARWIFRASNTNVVLPHLYSEAATFGNPRAR